MKLVYLNDTKTPQYVFLHSLARLFKKLDPAEAVEVEVQIADDQKLFVKTWGERVLIGRTE